MIGIQKKWIFVILIAGGMTGFWYVSEQTAPHVYVAKENIPKGTLLTPMLFELEKVQAQADWMVSGSDKKWITGTYAHAPIGKDEFANRREIANTPIVAYQDGEGTIGVKATDQEAVVGWQLEKGDLVAVAAFDRDKKVSMLIPELSHIVVDALINRDGQDIAYISDRDKKQIATINLKVTAEQAKLIDEYQKKGSITLIRQGKSVGDSTAVQ